VNEFATYFLTALGGVLFGALVAYLLSRARRLDLEEEIERMSQPETAAELLDVIASSGALVDGVNNVVHATVAAQTLGIKIGAPLPYSELAKLASTARETAELVESMVELATGITGESLTVLARAALLSDGSVLLVLDDMTEAQRLDETRRDFIANISHELKTPIGAISLLSEALADADDQTMIRKFSSDLHSEAQRLAHLVQDIIQLSRLQGTEVAKTAQPVDLASVIDEAVERNRVLSETRRVRVKVDAPRGVSALGDRELLVTAIKNLIENAINYSDEGSQVGVGLRHRYGVAAIAVADNGVGIAPEHQERIFERFYRADPSRSRQTGGTGLGLSIVKHIALKHLGDVQLFSQPGLGSTFTFRIPIAKLSQNEKDGQ
jgi:two-component system sensor histidine kinase SenX3